MKSPISVPWILPFVGLAIVVSSGCSGPGEDVRVSLCKDLSQALQSPGHRIEWTGNENKFRRPEYAIAELRYEAIDASGGRTSMRSACYYEHESVDDTALDLADPFSAYATLPYKMTVDGLMLPNTELLALVNAEHRRRGQAVVDTLRRGTQDAVGALRSTVDR